MLSIQKWKCSWSLAAAIASIVALVSVVHLFLFPLGPSFDFLRQSQNFCIPVNGSSEDQQPAADLDHRFPAGLHKEVIYRGAPWKAEIGRWLSGCDSITKEVSTVEVMRNDFAVKGLLSLLFIILKCQLHIQCLIHIIQVCRDFV